MGKAAQKAIDGEQVRRMAAIGCTDREIALVLAVSEATLRRRCRAALDAGRASLRRSLRRKQWEVARKGNVPMLIWLGKQYLGQSDRQEVIHGERVAVVEEVVWPNESAGADANGAGATDARAT